MERIMQSQPLLDASKQAYMRGKKVLEINPRHPISKELQECSQGPRGHKCKASGKSHVPNNVMETGFTLSEPNDFASRIYGQVKSSLNISPDAATEEKEDVETEVESSTTKETDQAKEEDSW